MAPLSRLASPRAPAAAYTIRGRAELPLRRTPLQGQRLSLQTSSRLQRRRCLCVRSSMKVGRASILTGRRLPPCPGAEATCSQEKWGWWRLPAVHLISVHDGSGCGFPCSRRSSLTKGKLWSLPETVWGLSGHLRRLSPRFACQI